MKLFINVGGRGTRLGDLTDDLPKPMLPIAGKPVLHHLLDWAKNNGITEFVFMSGYKAEKIVEYFGDGSKFGVTIHHSVEPFPLDSGGPIKYAAKYIDGIFIYMSGDQICDVNLNNLLAYHNMHKPDMTVFVNPTLHHEDSDILQVDDTGRIIKFVSKWDNHTGAGNLANRGLNVIEPNILQIMDREVFNFENYLYPRMLSKGMKMMAYHTDEFMEDMGTPDRFKRCENYLYSKMKVLITGAGGMMGAHMIEFLLKKGCKILGTYYNPTTDLSEIPQGVDMRQLDVRDADAVYRLLEEFKPDRIFHLAAQSYPTVSWDKPATTMDINVNGTINLFEAIKKLKLDPEVMVACSSAQYGFVNEEDVPVKETQPMLPLHPYGVSKVGQDLLTYQYYKNDGIRGFRIRIFNTTGPKKVNDVCSDFTKQAIMIEKGLKDPTFRHGNLQTRRSITDVRDAINAFWLATEHGKPGEVYNFSGEKAYLIQDILDLVVKETGITPNLFQDPKLMRPTDEKIIFGDASKLKSHTGWKQQIPIEQTIKDMIEYWRNKL